MNKPCSVVVLISGNGTNLQAIIDSSQQAPYTVVAVISNKADAYGLQRADQHGIINCVINHQDFDNRELFDQALMREIDQHQPDLVVLAGFMRILSAGFVQHYAGRMLNIHPSLLPKYPGTNTHQRALAAKDKTHGASVHFVTEQLDGGPIIAQITVPVEPQDNAEILANRVAEKEHLLYPQVVSWFAEGRLTMQDRLAKLDGEVLTGTGVCVGGLDAN